MTEQGRKKKHDVWGWLAFAVLVLLVAPIYVLAASLAVRAGLFDFDSNATVSAEDSRAIWGFLGAAVAAAVTATGLLLTRSHNIRSLALQQEVEDAKVRADHAADARLKLDTAVASIQLLGEGDTYATRAQVAGALTTLVHLEHPVISLRCLAAAWPDTDAVDADTASWIMDAAFATGGAAAQHEAVQLARHNISKLVAGVERGSISIPDFGIFEWGDEIDWDARVNVVKFLLEIYAEVPIDWHPSMLIRFHRIFVSEPSDDIRTSVTGALEALASLDADNVYYPSGTETIHVAELRQRVAEALAAGITVSVPTIDEKVDQLRERIHRELERREALLTPEGTT